MIATAAAAPTELEKMQQINYILDEIFVRVRPHDFSVQRKRLFKGIKLNGKIMKINEKTHTEPEKLRKI